jgi:hypothetical protein
VITLICMGCHEPFKSDGSGMTCDACKAQQAMDSERKENERLTGIVRQYEGWLERFKRDNSFLRQQIGERDDLISQLNQKLEHR